MLILLIGATYAFYTLQVSDSQTESNFNVELGDLNSIAIKGLVSSLHLNVTAEDMSLENAKSYYATKEEKENYKTDINLATYNIAQLEITGNITSENTCTGEIEIVLANGKDSMRSVLDTGDVYLYINGGDVEERLDLSKIKDVGSKTYNVKFQVNNNDSQTVKAYIELVNKSTEQNYLAGRELNIEININNFKCSAGSKNLAMIEENAKGQLETEENMEARGDTLRRFQGDVETVKNNYICFGSTNKEDCTFVANETVDDKTAKSNSDKYAYRIMGIVTEDNPEYNEEKGQIKVIKKEALNTGYYWSATGAQYKWNNSDLNNGINGAYFLNNYNAYPYMSDRTWATKISVHNWHFGDIPYGQTTGIYDTTSGADVYKKEKELWNSETNAGSSPSKIGLMYIHDYILATQDGENKKCVQSSSNDYSTCRTSWIHVLNNDTGAPGRENYEWTMTRQDTNYAYVISRNGDIGSLYFINYQYSVRPVFYIDKDFVIASGSGTLEDPYIFEEPKEEKNETLTLLEQNGEGQLETKENQLERGIDSLRRYQGTKDTILNNYICFGANTESECKFVASEDAGPEEIAKVADNNDKYAYRIIGIDIITNQLKVIKKEALDTARAWHSSYGSDSYTWNNVMLYKQLNGIDTGNLSSYPNNIFLTNTNYVPSGNVGSKTWNTMIETINWRYGDIDSSSDGASQAGPGVLTKEKTWTDTVEAKIGLMYLSDYYLAYDNTSNWYSKSGSDNWLFIDNNDTSPIDHVEWTMSRFSSSTAWRVRSSGDVFGTYDLTNTDSVRPVFYLSEKIKLSGKGTITDPYVITDVSE